jgi:hypothetical protein
MISGARYQRVTTYSVRLEGCSSSASAPSAPAPAPAPPSAEVKADGLLMVTPRANPKSQIFRSQFEFSRMLDGLRSRCSTSAEWMYFSAHRIWYRKY